MASATTQSKLQEQYGDDPETLRRAQAFLIQNPSATANDVSQFLKIPADYQPNLYYSSNTKSFYALQENGNYAIINLAGDYGGTTTAEALQKKYGTDLGGLKTVTSDNIGSITSKGQTVLSTASSRAKNVSNSFSFGSFDPTSLDVDAVLKRQDAIQNAATSYSDANGNEAYYDASGNLLFGVGNYPTYNEVKSGTASNRVALATPAIQGGTSFTSSKLGGGTTFSPAANGMTAVTLGNGQTVYYDTTGQAYDANGGTLTQSQIASATSGSAKIVGTPTAGTSTTSSNVTQAQQLTDQQFQSWLSSQNLTADQKTMLTSIYGALGTHDEETANRIAAALKAGAAYSDPVFKAQVTLAVDALQRGLASKEGDLQYQEQVSANTLKDLQDNIAASKDYLSFQNQQELTNLARQKGQDLETLQNDLASKGFTSSSIRSNKEGILSDTYGGLVESANRSFTNQTASLDRQLTAGERDYALNTQRLQELAASGKLDLLREAEGQVGSQTLADLGYTGLLGNIGGSIPANQAKDTLAYANSLVF